MGRHVFTLRATASCLASAWLIVLALALLMML